MPFRIALSGLNAAQTDLSVTANNIANTSTNGFKGSRAEFADLFAVSLQGVSSNATGNGVRVAAVAQQFAQGNIEFTDSSLDLAVSGQGFFIVDRRRRARLHARRRFPAQSRRLRRQRAAAAPAGLSAARRRRLQHRRSRRPAPADHGLAAGGHDQRRIPAEPARERHAAAGRAVRSGQSEHLQPGDLAHAVRLAGRDAHRHDVLRKDRRTPNEWTARLYIDGTAVGAPQTLQYSQHRPADGAGRRRAPVPGLHAHHRRGRHEHDLRPAAVDAVRRNFSVNAITQDGYTTGRLIGIDINETGVVQARFTNGLSQPLGQVAIANFANPQGLQQLGNTHWAETFASGQALRGQAGNSGFGLVQSGALEGAERRHHRAAGEHDHRAAQLPGERADDLHRRLDHPDHHQHPLRRGQVASYGPHALRRDDRREGNPARADRQQPQPRQREHDRLSRRLSRVPEPRGRWFRLRLARVRHQRVDRLGQPVGRVAVDRPRSRRRDQRRRLDRRAGPGRQRSLHARRRSAGRRRTACSRPAPDSVLGDGGPITVPPYTSIFFARDGSISIVPLGQTPGHHRDGRTASSWSSPPTKRSCAATTACSA